MNVAVDDRRRGALVLANDGPDLGRGEDEEFRCSLADNLGRFRFVGRVAKAVQEGNDDPFRTPRLGGGDRVPDTRFVERCVHRSVGAEALSDAEDPIAGDQQFRSGRERLYDSGMRRRATSSTSVKFSVVKRAIVAPLRWITVLTPTVVPWMKLSTALGAIP